MKYHHFIFSTLMFFCISCKIEAQEISTFPGIWRTEFYQDDIRVKKKYVTSIMQQHEHTKIDWNKSILHSEISIAATVTTILLLYWQAASNARPSNRTSSFPIRTFAALGTAVAAIGFTISAKSLRRKAILNFNKLNTENETSYIIGQTSNGLGLVCTF